MKLKILAIFILFILLATSLETVNANNPIENITENLKKQNNPSNDFLFDLKIQFLMKRAGMPSLSACIIKNNTVVWSKSYGFSNIRQRERAN